MSKDILSDYFKYYIKCNKTKSYSKNSNCKKRNYLNKYDIYDTENNILKFTPKTIKIKNRHIFNIKPYKLNEKQNLTNIDKNSEIYQNKAKSNKSINNINNIINRSDILQNLNNNINNKKNLQKQTSSTYYFSSGDDINKKMQILSANNRQKIKSVLSNSLKNKLKYNKFNINEEANKIVNYYLTTDLSNINKNTDAQEKEFSKVEKAKKNIKSKFLLEKKLLKMSNIRHKLMTGHFSDFKSINIQKRTLGKEKNRKNLLKSIEDYYMDQPYKLLDNYIIDKEKNFNLDIDKMTNKFKFKNYIEKLSLSERMKKRSDYKYRERKINEFYSFNKAKSNIDKTKFMNFYENMYFLSERVKNTEAHLKKSIDIRTKFKDNIKSLFIV